MMNQRSVMHRTDFIFRGEEHTAAKGVFGFTDASLRETRLRDSDLLSTSEPSRRINWLDNSS